MADYKQQIPTINFEKIEGEQGLHKTAGLHMEVEQDRHIPVTKNGKDIIQALDMNKEVVVVDIQMPFASMVACMIKWTLAAILAVIIICATFILGVFIAAGLIYGLTGENILGNILTLANIF